MCETATSIREIIQVNDEDFAKVVYDAYISTILSADSEAILKPEFEQLSKVEKKAWLIAAKAAMKCGVKAVVTGLIDQLIP